jgi:hypothetical protein
VISSALPLVPLALSRIGLSLPCVRLVCETALLSTRSARCTLDTHGQRLSPVHSHHIGTTRTGTSTSRSHFIAKENINSPPIAVIMHAVRHLAPDPLSLTGSKPRSPEPSAPPHPFSWPFRPETTTAPTAAACCLRSLAAAEWWWWCLPF